MDADARLDAAVGSVADEAAKLLEALGRSQGSRGQFSSATAESDEESESSEGFDDASVPSEHVHVAMGDAETCTWCPVCRSVTLLKGVSPETLGRLADLATAAATLLADMATRHTESSSSATAERAPSERSPRTEPIAVVDEEELS
ncbi:hypothetical protein JNB_01540 [Janibacter sp. HTCC2649]|uniref:hypothetical protein n=1 Tax=Janibacter sp. HTCC2649 TaxID=313589 RepID=UPI000066EB41|nr:hypothetical protein [Janibacter sp. HTCC2649]EAP98810.1 hypothetical protein JNB_01540 [Janibacter sp. HTCC2649]